MTGIAYHQAAAGSEERGDDGRCERSLARQCNGERLAEIEREFHKKIDQGCLAADISDKRELLIQDFDPNAEILLIPRVQGG
jgi:hypothetical protein